MKNKELTPQDLTPRVLLDIADITPTVNELLEIKEKYYELIMQVGRKFQNESRHETALRYIKETEERAHSGSPNDAKINKNYDER